MKVSFSIGFDIAWRYRRSPRSEIHTGWFDWPAIGWKDAYILVLKAVKCCKGSQFFDSEPDIVPELHDLQFHVAL